MKSLTANGTSWQQAIVSLDPLWGNIKIRFFIDTIDNFANDGAGWFIDDFLITGTSPASEDIAVTGVSPSSTVFNGQPTDYTVTVSNIGTGGVSADGTVGLDVDGDGIDDGSGIFSSLPTGTSTTVTINVAAPSTAGSYTLNASATLTSGVDGNLANNSFSSSYNVNWTNDLVFNTASTSGASENAPLDFDCSISNPGMNSADFDINVDTDGDGIVDFIQSFTGLLPGTTGTFTANTTAPGVAGNYTANLSVQQTNAVDEDPSNDNASTNYTVISGSSSIYTIGTGTAVNTPTGYPTPLGNYYWGNRTQYMYEGSELTGTGMSPGETITHIGVFIDNLNSLPDLNNFTVYLANSSASNMTNWETNMTLVYGPVTLPVAALVAGDWNMIPLDNSFMWDGSSNLIVETCSNNTGWVGSGNAAVRYTTSTLNPSAKYYRADAAGVCSNPAQTGVSTNRANVRFFANPPSAEDLYLLSIAPPSPAFAGQNGDFDVTVSNVGSAGLVADGTIEIDTDGDGIADASTTFTGLAGNSSQIYTISAPVPGTTGSTGFGGTVTLTSGVDGNAGNDTWTGSYTVLPTEDVEFVSLSTSSAPASGSQTFNATVQNNGLDPADGTVEIDIDNDGVMDISDSFSGLASGSSTTLSIPTTAPAIAGVYTANGLVSLTSGIDQDNSNDAATTTYSVLPGCVTTYPYTETFDSWPTTTTGSSTNLPFPASSGWEQDQTTDNRDWNTFGGSTGSANTGPTQDYTKEQTGVQGNYLYTESSGPPVGSVFRMYSICLDLSTLAAPKLSFFYHIFHNNQTTGEFHVDIENMTTGTTDLDVWSLIGQWQTAEAAPWANKTISLIPYVGNTIRVVFRSVVGGPTNFYNDTGVDQFSVFDSADDISITAFSLNGAAPAGNPATFDVTIFNAGSNTADGTVEVDFDGDGIAEGSDSFSGLASGASTALSISGTAPSIAGPYTATANATLTSGTDGNSLDNTATTNYTVTPTEDVAVNSVSITPDVFAVDSFFDVFVEIENLGASPADVSIDVDINGDGIADASSTILGLASGATQTEPVNVQAPSATGTYNADVTATLTNGIDQDPTNDTGSAPFMTVLAGTNVYTYGTGTDVNTSTGYPTPFANWYWGNRTQYMYEGSELTASGLTAGENITHVGLFIDNLNALPDLENFTVYLANSSAPDMTNWETNMSLGYGPITLPVAALVAGDWNMLQLDTPFMWDGSSNLVVETCSNNSGFVSNGNASVRYTNTTLNPSVKYYRADAAGVCSNPAQTGVSTNRANMRIFAAPPSPEDLALTTINPPVSAFNGQTGNFDVTISNVGTANNPADGTIELDTDNDGISDASATFTGLAGGATQNYTINAPIPSALGPTIVSGTVTLTNGIDGNVLNDTHSTNYNVVPSDNIGISSVALNGSAPAGNPATFDVTIENLGFNLADGTVDVDFDNDGIADGSGTFTGLLSGNSTVVSVSGTAPSPAGTYTASTTATLTSGIDGDASDNTDLTNYTVSPTIDVGVTNLTGPTAPAAGSTNNYTCDLMNYGISPASGTLDFDVDGDGTPEVIGQAYGPIAPGATESATITATLPIGVAGSFTATVTQTLTGDGDASNNSDTFMYSIPLAGCGSNSLTTTFASGNGSNGNMFDIVAINDVVVTCFDVHFDPGTADFEVWAITGGGTYVGSELSNANWTLVGTALGVTSSSLAFDDGIPTQLPILINVPIAAGATQGFYVTKVTGSVNYTNGTTLGAVFSQDANIQFLEGKGGGYFSVTFTPRIFNGNIYYSLGQSIDAPVVAIDGATLGWNAITGANNYWVYKANNPNGPFTAISAGNVTIWTDPDGTTSITPFYYVTADSDPPVVAAPSVSSGISSLKASPNYTITITNEQLEEYKELNALGFLDADVKTWLLQLYPNLFSEAKGKLRR